MHQVLHGGHAGGITSNFSTVAATETRQIRESCDRSLENSSAEWENDFSSMQTAENRGALTLMTKLIYCLHC